MKNFFIKYKKKILYSILAFSIGVILSYSIVNFGGKAVWNELSKVFPIPVASVNGTNIFYESLSTAKKLEAPSALDFVIKQTQIKVLGDLENIEISTEEVDENISKLPSDWKDNLSKSSVNESEFISLFVEPEIIKDKIIIKNNSLNSKIENVQNLLTLGELFENVAKQYSEDWASAIYGGDIGLVERKNIDEIIWEKAVVLENGQWVGPINTAEGYIFVKKIISDYSLGAEHERLNLRVIVIKSFNFDKWFLEKTRDMEVKRYIK